MEVIFCIGLRFRIFNITFTKIMHVLFFVKLKFYVLVIYEDFYYLLQTASKKRCHSTAVAGEFEGSADAKWTCQQHKSFPYR